MSANAAPVLEHELDAKNSATITVPEIARRLGVHKDSVYGLLQRRVIPAMRVGRKWIISRHAYARWEATIGERMIEEAPDRRFENTSTRPV